MKKDKERIEYCENLRSSIKKAEKYNKMFKKMMIEAYTKQASLSMMEAAKLTIELAD